MTTTADVADFALGLDYGDLRGQTVDELTERFENGELPAVVTVEPADGTTYLVELLE